MITSKVRKISNSTFKLSVFSLWHGRYFPTSPTDLRHVKMCSWRNGSYYKMLVWGYLPRYFCPGGHLCAFSFRKINPKDKSSLRGVAPSEHRWMLVFLLIPPRSFYDCQDFHSSELNHKGSRNQKQVLDVDRRKLFWPESPHSHFKGVFSLPAASESKTKASTW